MSLEHSCELWINRPWGRPLAEVLTTNSGVVHFPQGTATLILLMSADSLRHTYIYLRLMEGADIYQIVKDCRTSVEMIEKFYASHIKTCLDSAAFNIMRKKVARAVAKELRTGT